MWNSVFAYLPEQLHPVEDELGLLFLGLAPVKPEHGGPQPTPTLGKVRSLVSELSRNPG